MEMYGSLHTINSACDCVRPPLVADHYYELCHVTYKYILCTVVHYSNSTPQDEEDASLVPQTNSNSGMFQFAPVNQSAPPKGFVL